MDDPVSIEDIRALIDPDSYKNKLEEAKSIIDRELAGCFVDRDLIDNNPEIEPDARATQLKHVDSMIRNLGWRQKEVQRRLDAAESGKVAMVKGI